MRSTHGLWTGTIVRTISLGRSLTRKRRKMQGFAVSLATVGCALLMAPSVRAQESHAEPPATVQAPAARATQPGLMDAVGRWLEEGATKLKTNIDSAQEKLGKIGTQAREATKEATGAS